jgi:hypothetical protein
MPRMLDLSDDVRAEIGDEEADRLLAGENAPGGYDCTSCRTPGDSDRVRTSTVLFIGEETAVLAFAHAACLPSQVVAVSEEQLQGAVRSITGESTPAQAAPGQAVLGVTSGLVLVSGELHPALVIEPTGPITRPGAAGYEDDFLPLLMEQGFTPISSVDRAGLSAPLLPGWSVLLGGGQLYAVLQPGAGGFPVTWWQAHEPLRVTDGWHSAATTRQQVLVLAAPVGSIGRQPREDLLRGALDHAAAIGRLLACTMPVTGI